MEIGKERAGASAREDGVGMLTPEDARELGLGPEAPEPYLCPHCGKPLERLGISVGGKSPLGLARAVRVRRRAGGRGGA